MTTNRNATCIGRNCGVSLAIGQTRTNTIPFARNYCDRCQDAIALRRIAEGYSNEPIVSIPVNR